MIITTISTTSGASSSVDSVINLNTGDTLPENVNLYASAVDSQDSSANFSFSWHLIRKPAGSSASLDDDQIQNPVLQDVDVWGDYRLFCIATNISSNANSESDPIKAPNSAFVQVRVRSTHKALVKPAPGERDWFSYAYEWVDAIESFDPLIDDHEGRITVLEASGASTTFEALTDTNFSTLVDGQAAIYNATSGKWVNGTVSSGGASNLLLADTDDDFTLSMATGRLTLSGTANEVEVVGVSSAGGVVMSVGLPNQVAIGDTLQVGGVITAQDEINVTGSLNMADAYVSGKIHDSASPHAYLIGNTNGWYMSDDGQSSSECKLMTRCTVPGTSTSTRGGVMLSTDKFSGHNTSGTIPSVHILTYSQQANDTIHTDDQTDTVPDTHDEGINASQSGSSQITSHCYVLFHNSTGGNISIETIDSCVLTGGFHDGQPYVFELVLYSDINDMLAQNPTNTGITVTHNQSSAWKPSIGNLTANNIATVPDGGYFGMRCVQSGKTVGHRYICNITAIRLN